MIPLVIGPIACPAGWVSRWTPALPLLRACPTGAQDA